VRRLQERCFHYGRQARPRTASRRKAKTKAKSRGIQEEEETQNLMKIQLHNLCAFCGVLFLLFIICIKKIDFTNHS